MSTSREREGARTLNSLTRKGLAYPRNADGPTLTNFIHEFFCGDDPVYDSPGKLSNFQYRPRLTIWLILLLDEDQEEDTLSV